MIEVNTFASMRMFRWHLLIAGLFFFQFSNAQDAHYDHELLEIVVLDDATVQKIIRDPQLYTEGWDRLAEPRFWQQVMKLSPDSSILNIAKSRTILHTFPTLSYDTLSTESKRGFKKQMIDFYELPAQTRLYVTYGKNHFYQHKKALPSIGKGIEVFLQTGTNPWYAQAIILIESPGKLQFSPVGAYGSFQLMKSVAISQGLIVNEVVDEREDFEKAAGAAARFIQKVCIPETKNLLRYRRIPFNEDDLWFRLLVLHVYHAGARNVGAALRQIQPNKGGIDLIRSLWSTHSRGFGNASQNYSQVALASLLELDRIIARECEVLCP